MEIQKYLEEMKLMQNNLLSFLENDGDVSDAYQNFITICDESDVHHHKHKIKSILYLISKISNNHHRTHNFFNKIGQIIQHLHHRIKHYFTDQEIFNVFKSNKRVLLLLFEEKIITVDENIKYVMVNGIYKTANYDYYFFPELQPFLDENFIKEVTETLPDDFEEKRKIGENDDYICEIIRNDFIHEFVDQVKKSKIHLNSFVKPSIYETNNFLIKNQTTLIEYAAFFGSIQIFKYLYQHLTHPRTTKKIPLKSPLWLFTIHGQNADMIYFLRENHFKLKPKNFYAFLKESIKCHHNEIANYVMDNFIDKNDDHIDTFSFGLQYYNFYFIRNDFLNGSVFYNLCAYDYYPIVHALLETNDLVTKRRQSVSRGLFVYKKKFFYEISK